MTFYTASLVDRDKKADIRLEAAMCKMWATERTWEIVNDTMQIRGGRGYETAASLAARGEASGAGGTMAARLPHQYDLRGIERNPAVVPGARGARSSSATRRADARHAKSFRFAPEDGDEGDALLCGLVSAAMVAIRLDWRGFSSRSRAPSSLRRAHFAAAGAHAFPRHGPVRAEAGKAAAFAWTLRRDRYGIIRHHRELLPRAKSRHGRRARIWPIIFAG